MIKVEISNGYVELNESISRKTMRIYKETLMAEASMGTDAKVNFAPGQLDKATQYMVEKQIIRAVEIKDDQEKEVNVNAAWLDNLDNRDYEAIEDAVLSIKEKAADQIKK